MIALLGDYLEDAAQGAIASKLCRALSLLQEADYGGNESSIMGYQGVRTFSRNLSQDLQRHYIAQITP